MNRARIPVALVALVALPSPALAQETTPAPARAYDEPVAPFARSDAGPVTQHWQAALNIDALLRKDASFDVLSDADRELAIGVSGSYSFWITGALALAPELGYAGSYTDGPALLSGAVHGLELTSHAGYGGLSARYELWGFFAPHARLAAGLAHTSLELHTEQDGSFETREWLPFVTAGLGVTVSTPDRLFQTRSGKLAALSLGLTVEGGYIASPALNATLDEPEHEGRLRLEQPSLGDLSRSSPYLRLALVARL